MLLFIISLFAAAVVTVRCVCIAASLNLRDWQGHIGEFFGIAIGHALMAGGSLALVFGKGYAGYLLLIGFASLVLFDRRRSVR